METAISIVGPATASGGPRASAGNAAEPRDLTVLLMGVDAGRPASPRAGRPPRGTHANALFSLLRLAITAPIVRLEALSAHETLVVFAGTGHAERALAAARGVLGSQCPAGRPASARARIGIDTGTAGPGRGGAPRSPGADAVHVARILMTVAPDNGAVLSERTLAAVLGCNAGPVEAASARRARARGTVMAWQLRPDTGAALRRTRPGGAPAIWELEARRVQLRCPA